MKIDRVLQLPNTECCWIFGVERLINLSDRAELRDYVELCFYSYWHVRLDWQFISSDTSPKLRGL